MSATPEHPQASQHMTRAALVIGFLFALGVAALKILEPFLIAGMWATIIVVASWPALLWLQARLGGRRWAATTLLTLGLLILLVMPLSIAITAAVVNASEIAERAKTLGSYRLPTPPEWIATLPLVGERLLELWNQVATTGIQGLLSQLAPYAGAVAKGLVARASGVGFLAIESVLALAFAALLYMRGEDAAQLVQRIGARIAGLRGANAVTLATRAIRGVAVGVGGTAVIQSVMTGIGLVLAGVPFAALLSGLAFVLCLIQVGTIPVLAPAVIWVFWSGDTGWGIFLAVWSVIVGTADNVLRPILIQRGVDLPFWLVFTGVVGGLFAFGLVGLFAGPVVLAVARMLLHNWLADGDGELLALQKAYGIQAGDAGAPSLRAAEAPALSAPEAMGSTGGPKVPEL
ncbi:AI-2E family transporter YdiK [Piscinibacter sakaiensis]|uniref:AI-2E family transporter YdiK n=1 Tax=Piscinibacter sakaiensis TaxID=1547922 RepID=UPI003AAF5021